MMTADEQSALRIVGDHGGRVPTTLPDLVPLASSVASAIVAGWLTERQGNYLMTMVGETALAAAIDTD